MDNKKQNNKNFILINKYYPNEFKYQHNNNYEYIYNDNTKMTK